MFTLSVLTDVNIILHAIWTASKQLNTSVFGDSHISTHADPTCGPSAQPQHPHHGIYHAGRLVQFWASEGAKFPKMGDFLPRMQINCPAKFDATSFILGGEIRNRTNKQNYKYVSGDWPTSTCRAIFYEWCISSVTFVVGLPTVNFPVAGRFIRFGASGGFLQVQTKCLTRQQTDCLTPSLQLTTSHCIPQTLSSK